MGVEFTQAIQILQPLELLKADLSKLNRPPVPIVAFKLAVMRISGSRVSEADGKINIADALFIAKYLVGLRAACTDVVDNTCLHSVNAASVRHEGAFDKKTIADALFIAQFLVSLRDESYNPTP